MTDKRQVAFLNGLAYDLNLPMLDEYEGVFCFNHQIPNPSCDPLTSLVGTIASDENGMHPTWDQCMEVFKLSWPFVTYWFGELFPDFTPPFSSIRDAYKTESVLWLWLLQFGPSTLKFDPEWQDLVSTFNDPLLDWSLLLAWEGPPVVYTTDGSTPKSFPMVLTDWLTASSSELELFNYYSEVCWTEGCALAEVCQNVYPGSTCA